MLLFGAGGNHKDTQGVSVQWPQFSYQNRRFTESEGQGLYGLSWAINFWNGGWPRQSDRISECYWGPNSDEKTIYLQSGIIHFCSTHGPEFKKRDFSYKFRLVYSVKGQAVEMWTVSSWYPSQSPSKAWENGKSHRFEKNKSERERIYSFVA